MILKMENDNHEMKSTTYSNYKMVNAHKKPMKEMIRDYQTSRMVNHEYRHCKLNICQKGTTETISA